MGQGEGAAWFARPIVAEAQMLSVVYGQAIEAERQREAVFAGTIRADIHGGAEWAAPLAAALEAEAQGRTDEAERLREAVSMPRPIRRDS